MFNDLNDKQNSAAVDDIFAETDKLASSNGASSIETKQAGLSSLGDKEVLSDEGVPIAPEYEDDNSVNGSSKILKIAIIVVVTAIVILGAYLIYVNFIAADKSPELSETIVDKSAQTGIDNNTSNTNPEPVVVNPEIPAGDDFIIPASEKNNDGLLTELIPDTTTPSIDPQEIDSDGDKLSDYDEINVYNTNPNLIDSDFDGLSDYEEVMIHKTNPLLADTDGDKLSDFEEVKTHKTDPLKIDTDGDGYSDFDEISNCYNPLGDGPLAGCIK